MSSNSVPPVGVNGKQWHWHRYNAVLNHSIRTSVYLIVRTYHSYLLFYMYFHSDASFLHHVESFRAGSMPVPQSALKQNELTCLLGSFPQQSLSNQVTVKFAGRLIKKLWFIALRLTLIFPMLWLPAQEGGLLIVSFNLFRFIDCPFVLIETSCQHINLDLFIVAHHSNPETT